jgi:hypothetical protein
MLLTDFSGISADANIIQSQMFRSEKYSALQMFHNQIVDAAAEIHEAQTKFV